MELLKPPFEKLKQEEKLAEETLVIKKISKKADVIDLKKKKHEKEDKKLGAMPGTSELADELEKEKVEAKVTELADEEKKE